MRPRLEIDEDIRTASTMPGWCYRDEAFFARVRERVLARSWQLAPEAARVTTPRQACPVTFLEGSVDEPLLLVRDGEDCLRCLSNVCTHRGALIAETPGRVSHLRCPYHGRRFGLDGRFEHMPEFGDAAGFPRPEDDLPRFALASWGPFVFVALDPAIPFEELLAPMRERLAWAPLDDLIFDPARSRDYLVEANWALYCDNYLEGFHIPFVHGALNDTLDYDGYRTELFPYASLQVGIARGGEDTLDLPASSPDHGTEVGGYYFWLFPTTMFNVYPWGISVNVVRPLGPGRTKVSFLTYVWDPARLDRGAGAGLDRVEREDEAIVESVQRGIASRGYTRGRYSPAREQGVHHFHRLLAQFAAE